MLQKLIAGAVAVLALTAAGPPAGAAEDPLQDEQWALGTIQAEQAWRVSQGANTVIAVVDTGVDLNHEDLAANLVGGTTIGCGRGGTDGRRGKGGGAAKRCDGQDDHGHGTHVAGIAAAVGDNGKGVSGVAPRARVMPVKVLDEEGSGSIDDVEKGIRYAADHGADVINLSLGAMSGVSQVGAAAGWFEGVHAAIDYAWARGAVVVVAAGNDAFPLCSEPAAHERALCVGATDRNDNPSAYSNSVEVDVWAPGGFGTVFCEDSARDIMSTILPGSPSDCDGGSFVAGYDTLAGTSMAAPHVSGVAALLLAKGHTNAEAVERILASTDDLSVVDPTSANPSGEGSAGRVNACKAVGGDCA